MQYHTNVLAPFVDIQTEKKHALHLCLNVMLCSEEKHNCYITCGYVSSRFQLLTSHRLSLSFYFIFMILSWWCFMSLCNELNGFLYHLLLLGSEQVTPVKNSIKVKTYKRPPVWNGFSLVSLLFHKIPLNPDVIKLKSLATIKDIVLFAVSRYCDHYVNPNYSHLCLHV